MWQMEGMQLTLALKCAAEGCQKLSRDNIFLPFLLLFQHSLFYFVCILGVGF